MRTLLQSYGAKKNTETPPFRYARARVWARALVLLRSGRGAKNSFFLMARRHRIQPPSQAGIGFRSGVGTHHLFDRVPISREINSYGKRKDRGPGVCCVLRPMHTTSLKNRPGQGGGRCADTSLRAAEL